MDARGGEKTITGSDVYRGHGNLPARFNDPDGFQGYGLKSSHPLYETSNHVYGSKRPSVHEMPTQFHGVSRQFSESMLHTGMFHDNTFNTSSDKSRITGPGDMAALRNRILFHHLYNSSQLHNHQHNNHN